VHAPPNREQLITGAMLFYEPFCGSGTTIIADEQTGRACHAIEIAPAYVDVAVKRFPEGHG
jgi:DNA modification methylase